MLLKKGIIVLLWIGLIADAGYTLFQQRRHTLDGDLASIVLPSPYYEPVLDSPFGRDAVFGDEPYASPNRFFVHWSMYHYFRSMPVWLGKIMGKVEGIFWSAALAKFAAHLMLLALLSWLISRKGGRSDWLVAAVLIVPLFQTSGYYQPVVGLIDTAPTYTFFYAYPTVLMLLFLSLTLRRWERPAGEGVPAWEAIALFGLVVILPFTGPLVPGVILLTGAIAGLQLLLFLLRERSLSWTSSLGKKLPSLYWLYLGLLFLLGVYSLYLGTLSTEQQHGVTLTQRYARLPAGVWGMLTNKPVLPLLIAVTGWQVYSLRKSDRAAYRKAWRSETRYILLFTFLYLVLLPMGGYRDYRPDIVRRDTVQPVLIGLFYLWGWSGLQLVTAKVPRPWILIPTAGLWLLLLFADGTDVRSSTCQEETLQELKMSALDTIPLPYSCPILTWEQIPEQDTQPPSELLVLWGILEEGQVFVYRK